jgi:hypothetical protein
MSGWKISGEANRRTTYIAWPDGHKFLIDTVIEETPSPLRGISNWDGQEFVSGSRAFNRVER